MDYILLILGVLFLITCFILWKIRKINPKKQIFKSLFQSGLEAEAEEIFYSSDIGPKMTKKLLSFLQEGQSLEALKHNLVQEFLPIQNSLEKIKFPYVAIFVGINGAGKTTSIGKLAYKFFLQKKKGIIIAADTFRAAAIDQLQIWADRVGVPIVKQQMGSDPASVAFDTLQSAVAQDADVVIMLLREDYYDSPGAPQGLPGITRVLVRKNRNGPVGEIQLKFRKESQKFVELAPEEQYIPSG